MSDTSSVSTKSRHRRHQKIILITLCTSFLSIAPVGYHLVVLNVPESIIQSAINTTVYHEYGAVLSVSSMSILWSTLVACQGIGAFIGCFFIVPLATRCGTKNSMLAINGAVLIMGSLIMALPMGIVDCVELLLIGRLLTGVYTGLACAFVPIFVHEVAPRSIKGALSCFMHIAVCIGTAFAAVLSLEFILGGANTWGYLLALPALFGCIQMVIAPMLPETPSYLLKRDIEDKAIESIRFYHGTGPTMLETMAHYNDECSEMPPQLSIVKSLRDRDTRGGLFLGACVSAAQIFCGSIATISYSTSMFNAVSFVDFLIPYLPAFGSIVSALMTLPSLYLVEFVGRRRLLINTLVLCVIADYLFLAFSLIAQNDTDTSSWASFGYAFTFLIFGIGYNVGVGPVAYFVPGELVAPKSTSAALALAVGVNWTSTVITTIVYYPLQTLIGGWAYTLFAIPTTCILGILIWKLPETSRKCRLIDGVSYGDINIVSKPIKVDCDDDYGTFC